MIRLIAAVDRKYGIAKNGGQPWHIPQDEEYFSRQTKKFGGVLLMGRKTFDTIGKPLSNRRNIVLTTSSDSIEGIEKAQDLEILNKLSDVWVIGGSSVFAQTIDKADEVYLTRIEANFGCDQFFPDLGNKFELFKRGELHEQNGFIFRYYIYRRLTI